MGSSLAKVKEAARIANVTEFVDQMGEGYDTIVGDRGVKLSGGQRQRIAIARAIVQTPEILILDEAVSSLDSYNERLITEALRVASHNRTSIIVAHRLSTVMLADRIVVLKDGRIEAVESHKELLKKSPEYQLLYNSQFQI
jgi:ATP-binding cassette subfamily B protein